MVGIAITGIANDSLYAVVQVGTAGFEPVSQIIHHVNLPFAYHQITTDLNHESRHSRLWQPHQEFYWSLAISDELAEFGYQIAPYSQLYHIGVEGFEPPITRPPGVCVDQATLHSVFHGYEWHDN